METMSRTRSRKPVMGSRQVSSWVDDILGSSLLSGHWDEAWSKPELLLPYLLNNQLVTKQTQIPTLKQNKAKPGKEEMLYLYTWCNQTWNQLGWGKGRMRGKHRNGVSIFLLWQNLFPRGLVSAWIRTVNSMNVPRASHSLKPQNIHWTQGAGGAGCLTAKISYDEDTCHHVRVLITAHLHKKSYNRPLGTLLL